LPVSSTFESLNICATPPMWLHMCIASFWPHVLRDLLATSCSLLATIDGGCEVLTLTGIKVFLLPAIAVHTVYLMDHICCYLLWGNGQQQVVLAVSTAPEPTKTSKTLKAFILNFNAHPTRWAHPQDPALVYKAIASSLACPQVLFPRQ